MTKLVIVGCGSAKRDRNLDTQTLQVDRFAAKDLYTSTYFAKKRDYAETIGDHWMILSALHGLIPPNEQIKPYDISIDNLDDEQLEAWIHRVWRVLLEWVCSHEDVEEIVVLAGKSYIEPLQEGEVFSAGIQPRVTFPLQQPGFEGFGDQMHWLKERVESYEHEQTTLTAPDGGVSSDD